MTLFAEGMTDAAATGMWVLGAAVVLHLALDFLKLLDRGVSRKEFETLAKDFESLRGSVDGLGEKIQALEMKQVVDAGNFMSQVRDAMGVVGEKMEKHVGTIYAQLSEIKSDLKLLQRDHGDEPPHHVRKGLPHE